MSPYSPHRSMYENGATNELHENSHLYNQPSMAYANGRSRPLHLRNANSTRTINSLSKVYIGTIAFLIFISGSAMFYLSAIAQDVALSNDIKRGKVVSFPVLHPSQEKTNATNSTQSLKKFDKQEPKSLVPLNIAVFPAISPINPTPRDNRNRYLDKLRKVSQSILEQNNEKSQTSAPNQNTSPHVTKISGNDCETERDNGIFSAIQNAGEHFCGVPLGGAELPSIEWDPTSLDVRKQTQMTIYDLPHVFKSTVISNFVLDLTEVDIARDINDLSEEGGRHDPRFKFHSRMFHCVCDETEDITNAKRKEPNYIWSKILAGAPDKGKNKVNIEMCGLQENGKPQWLHQIKASKRYSDYLDISIPGNTIIIARKDDHNPFFQVSNALNTWIMLKALGWDTEDTRLVHLDAGFSSPVDQLHQKLFSPNNEIITGAKLMGHLIRFPNPVLIAPYENTGPMMQHLDDDEPCYSSQLFIDFREVALDALNVPVTKHFDDETIGEILITVITRQSISGRPMERMWLNDEDIVTQMLKEYENLGKSYFVKILRIDFADMPLEEQMRIIVQSDVVIGMHGAGLVNIMWSRPQTLVIEIFPKYRKRWGYRNLCQFIGCEWHEFRGGVDTGKGDNTSNKMIPYSEWKEFFDPLFQRVIARISRSAALTKTLQENVQNKKNEEELEADKMEQKEQMERNAKDLEIKKLRELMQGLAGRWRTYEQKHKK